MTDVFWTNSQAGTILKAAEAGKWEDVWAMLPRQQQPSLFKHRLLEVAIKNGEMHIIDLFLTEAPELASHKDVDGNTLLHSAVSQCQDAVVERLLTKYRVSVNARNNGGFTPLHIAVQGKENETQQSILARLLSYKWLKPFVKAGDGQTPLTIAITKGSNRSIEKLLNVYPAMVGCPDNGNFYPIHYAVIHGRHEAVDIILRMSNEVTRLSSSGRTVLHLAAENWNKRASEEESHERLLSVQNMLSAGVDVNAKEQRKGDTALHIFVRQLSAATNPPDAQLWGLIRCRSPDITLVDLAEKCRPAWQFALVCYLVLHKASLTVANHEGQTPLGIVETAFGDGGYFTVLDNFANISREPANKSLEEITKAVSELQVALERKTADYEELEQRLECPICFTNRLEVVFQCGHQLCSSCATQLTICHTCRQTIKQRINIYS